MRLTHDYDTLNPAMMTRINNPVIITVRTETSVSLVLPVRRTPRTGIFALPVTGYVDELDLIGRVHDKSFLIVFRLFIGPVNRAIAIDPICNLKLTFISCDGETAPMQIVQHGALTTLINCFLTSGVRLVHFVLLSKSLTPTCSISLSGWLSFFLLIHGECLKASRSLLLSCE
jgi:hypothetical protein